MAHTRSQSRKNVRTRRAGRTAGKSAKLPAKSPKLPVRSRKTAPQGRS